MTIDPQDFIELLIEQRDRAQKERDEVIVLMKHWTVIVSSTLDQLNKSMESTKALLAVQDTINSWTWSPEARQYARRIQKAIDTGIPTIDLDPGFGDGASDSGGSGG